MPGLLLASAGCAEPIENDDLALETSSAALTSAEETELANALAPSAALLEGDKFVLTQAEWFTIQQYAQNGLALPRNEASVRHFLSLSEADDYTSFRPLELRFAEVYSSAYDWESRLFPQTVDLAGDLINYAETADVFYEPLFDAVALLGDTNPSNDASAREDIAAIAGYLAEEASFYEERAVKVERDLHDFGTALTEDGAALRDLYEGYKRQYGQEDGELGRLRDDIERLQGELAQANRDYDHYVAVAASTPAYAWAGWPFGMIAAVSVAGTYGNLAVQKLNDIQQLRNQIASVSADAARRDHMMTTLYAADTGASTMAQSIAAALPAVGKIRSHWQLVRQDLEKAADIMSAPFSDKRAVVIKGIVTSALKKWTAVGDAAEQYTRNAYIQVQP